MDSERGRRMWMAVGDQSISRSLVIVVVVENAVRQ